ncbi:hypothetical protein LCGC14_2880190 [marine sediment metagenome]|uniref:Uncharacterized protein n=1 Tax=marine sediment metagenome TaxID=412755 RepID=A0A0F9ARH5_9ZZZZ
MRIILMFILVLLVITGFIFLLTGCSFSLGQKTNTEPVFTGDPPPPATQLWNAAKKSNWLVTISIIGLAAGVFALVNGSAKLGIACMASSSVSLFLALAVARFAAWMAIFGLVGSASAALFSILARRKALVEIIKGVQKTKDGLSTASTLNKELAKQSTTTRKIVGKIKNELKLKGAI